MTDDPLDDPTIDWSKCTFEGAERESLRAWRRLSFDEKLRALEEMNDFLNEMIAHRQAMGQPYIDPETGQVVPGRKPDADTASVSEKSDAKEKSVAPLVAELSSLVVRRSEPAPAPAPNAGQAEEAML